MHCPCGSNALFLRGSIPTMWRLLGYLYWSYCNMQIAIRELNSIFATNKLVYNKERDGEFF